MLTFFFNGPPCILRLVWVCTGNGSLTLAPYVQKLAQPDDVNPSLQGAVLD
jgi:hypothetical protein